MKIHVGADHNGFTLKNQVTQYLKKAGYNVHDDGGAHQQPDDDFPVYAQKVVTDMLSSEDKEPRGILLCGSGQGMCMAANRYKGIRALLGYDHESVRSARNDDDANILCLPAHRLSSKEVMALIDTFLNTPFAAAPRFVRRINELDNMNG